MPRPSSACCSASDSADNPPYFSTVLSLRLVWIELHSPLPDSPSIATDPRRRRTIIPNITAYSTAVTACRSDRKRSSRLTGHLGRNPSGGVEMHIRVAGGLARRFLRATRSGAGRNRDHFTPRTDPSDVPPPGSPLMKAYVRRRACQIARLRRTGRIEGFVASTW